jgi:periplasmic protein TonB
VSAITALKYGPDLPSSGLMIPANEGRGTLSTPDRGRTAFGLASLLLHGAALVVLTLMVTRPLPPAPPEEVVVELVFEQPPVPAIRPAPPEPVEAPPPVIASPVPKPVAPPPAPPAEAPSPVIASPVPEPVAPPPEPTVAQPTPSPELPSAPPTPMAVPVEPPLAPPPIRQPAPLGPKPLPRIAPRQPVARPSLAEPTPSAAAAPIAAPAAPPATAPTVDPRWQAAVSAWIAAHKVYPEDARRRGEEGPVGVRFTVDRLGRVIEAAVVAGSGSGLLDQAALALLRQAVLPAFPSDMTEQRVTIRTSIRYSLR